MSDFYAKFVVVVTLVYKYSFILILNVNIIMYTTSFKFIGTSIIKYLCTL